MFRHKVLFVLMSLMRRIVDDEHPTQAPQVPAVPLVEAGSVVEAEALARGFGGSSGSF